MEGDFTAPGLLAQGRTDRNQEKPDSGLAPASNSDSESEEFGNDEVLVSRGEELELLINQLLGS